MGAGKSTLGNKLARALGYDFYDSDHEIEKATGVDIGWIFDAEGEEGFRDRESQQLQLLLQKHDCIIATGGGVVLREQNRDLLRAHSTVIYVEVDIEVQLARYAVAAIDPCSVPAVPTLPPTAPSAGQS